LKLVAFPPQAAFLPALAQAWLATAGDPADGVLILPNRRAARAAAGAFLQANQGRPLLLPRIIALGAIDEAGLTLHGALDLPPAVAPLRRQAILANLILARNGANGAPNRLHTAWALAGDLATLLDEADDVELDFSRALENIVPADLASHWQTTLQFLDIVTHAWPLILAEMGMLNPAARQSRLIDAQAQAWATSRPPGKIWLVAREANPALARLARVVAGLAQGTVILPDYDPRLVDEDFEAIVDSHAQSSIARLLGAIGARRADIALWPAPPSNVPAGRAALLSDALLPAAALHRWQSPAAPPDTSQLYRLTARDEAEEATAIAMILRDALEIPGRSAALITPDRGLAKRVAAILVRFGILADDSAGEILGDTPPAILLRLLANAAAAEFAPVPLLALLKHPLTAAGLDPALCRRQARALEIVALRGPRPPPGFDGIKYRLDQQKNRQSEIDFLARLESRLLPITGLPQQIQPAEALRRLIEAAEAIAATADEPGAAELWTGEAGAALCEHLLNIMDALADLPDIDAADLPALTDALLAGGVVRKPRTRDGHPRIAIWGVQEAALQTVDVAVLAGLVEGIWPAAADPGTWLSRPMRKAAGLPAPERQIGLESHDFAGLANRCATVILSAPSRRDRAPAVPARWLTRLDAFLQGTTGAPVPPHPAAAWAQLLDQPITRELRPRPEPRPPAALRPTTLSISDIATLMADPYAIYARKILNLRELNGIDEESDPSQFGDIVHAGLAAFFNTLPDFQAPDTATNLTLALQTAMRVQRPRAALDHWWEARLARIAGWIVEAERERRRAKGVPVAIALEQSADMPVGTNFILKGRADRIEQRRDGSIFIMDYKTGTPPKEKDVESGTAPQLPLEAVMAEAGAFGRDFFAPVTELAFWKLSGRHLKGEDKELFKDKPDNLRAAIDDAAKNLPAMIAKFANPATPYLAKPHPGRRTYKDVYAGISRRGEWGGQGDDDSD
jgi:ATP-dependent helicase/nuclease subunit B